MTKIAVFGDVHANVEALQAVLADAREAGCTDYYCTGDLIGYHSDPNACVDLVRALACPVVRGNHDEDGAGMHPLFGLSRRARRSLLWTREVLSETNRIWLQTLPLIAYPTDDAVIVHATLHRPGEWGYVLKLAHAERHFRQQLEMVCFHGHTHLPITYIHRDVSVEPCDDRRLDLDPRARYLINVGSVGKPRDEDERASYVIYEPDHLRVCFRRVAYDHDAALTKSEQAGLLDIP